MCATDDRHGDIQYKRREGSELNGCFSGDFFFLYTGESCSVVKQLPRLSDLREWDASVVYVSMCDLSGSPDGRCDICVVLWNCIVAGPVVSDNIPPMMAQDLHKSLN
jgi:hypothetical protein